MARWSNDKAIRNRNIRHEDVDRRLKFAVGYLGKSFKPIITKMSDVIDPGLNNFDVFGESDYEELAKTIWGISLYSNLIARQHVMKNKVMRIQTSVDEVPNIPFRQAIQDLLNRNVVTRMQFDKLTDFYKLQSFTMAHVSSVESLAKIKATLVKAMEEGQTFKQWADMIRDNYDKLGITPKTPYHLETVFRTNMASAYMAGRIQLIQNNIEKIKYLRYLASPMACEKICLPLIDYIASPMDQFWAVYMPPNHYNCRCDIEIIFYDEDPENKIEPSPNQQFPPVMKGFESSLLQETIPVNVQQTAQSLGMNISKEVEQLRKLKVELIEAERGSGYDISANKLTWAVKEGRYALLHEMGHAAMKHKRILIDPLKMTKEALAANRLMVRQQEIDAWRYAMQLIKPAAEKAKQECLKDAIVSLQTYGISDSEKLRKQLLEPISKYFIPGYSW